MRNEQEARNEMETEWNAYTTSTCKSTRIYLFTAQLSGWWGNCGAECWKAGNNYRRIILAFQHYQTLSLSIFGMEWGL